MRAPFIPPVRDRCPECGREVAYFPLGLYCLFHGYLGLLKWRKWLRRLRCWWSGHDAPPEPTWRWVHRRYRDEGYGIVLGARARRRNRARAHRMGCLRCGQPLVQPKRKQQKP